MQSFAKLSFAALTTDRSGDYPDYPIAGWRRLRISRAAWLTSGGSSVRAARYIAIG